jgi:Polysaccharide deacetylase
LRGAASLARRQSDGQLHLRRYSGQRGQRRRADAGTIWRAGNFYISGALVGRWSGHWSGASAGGILDLHRSGHEIACHTFSHKRAIEPDAAAMSAEIETNRRYFHALDPSIRLENFA